MPRSGPGSRTGAPSSTMRPLLGRSSPATSRSKVDLPQPDGPEDGDEVVVGDGEVDRLERARRRAPAHARKGPRDVLDRELAHARLQGNSRRLPHLNRKSEIRPITPITMMPKMIWPVASSAWLSMIMWPMPEEEPISSATIT